MIKKITLATSLATALFASSATSEITATLGGNHYEGNELKESLAYGLRYGIFTDSFVDQVELMIEKADTKVRTTEVDNDLMRYGANAVLNIFEMDYIKPYVLVGLGYEDLENEVDGEFESSPYLNYGLGLRYPVLDNLDLKTELRHIYKVNNHDNELVYTVGVSIPFGKKSQKVETKPEPKPIPKAKPVVAKKVEPKIPLDSDKDGVIDELDKCPNTPKGFAVDKDGCELVFNFSANFDTNKSDIKDEFRANIDRFAKFLETSAYDVEIQGHTDSVGSEKYNQNLSQKRADAIKNYLIKLGIEKSRLTSVGFGESKPVASNDTEDGRYQNRRVEAVLNK
jgi:OOP family OmpA-OmpF porin